jgi:hypothetical protein
MIHLRLMDYTVELNTFKEMVRGDDSRRLLLLSGESGQGKTRLIGEFIAYAGGKLGQTCEIFDFQAQVGMTPHDVMETLCRCLGRGRFPTYRECAREFACQPVEQRVERSLIFRAHVQQEALGAVGLTPEQVRILTRDFFADLEERPPEKRVVLLFDQFEEAGIEMQEWLRGSFLREIRPLRTVLVVIAGQAVPPCDAYWQQHGYSFELRGVKVEDYVAYARSNGLPHSEETIRALHSCLEGRPSLYVKWVARQVTAEGGGQ